MGWGFGCWGVASCLLRRRWFRGSGDESVRCAVVFSFFFLSSSSFSRLKGGKGQGGDVVVFFQKFFLFVQIQINSPLISLLFLRYYDHSC